MNEMLNRLLLFCRPGFEADAAEELITRAAEQGLYGYQQPSVAAGTAIFVLPDSDATEVLDRLALSSLVFVRDWFVLAGVVDLPQKDRVGAVEVFMGDLSDLAPDCERLAIRTAENVTDADLNRFAKKWTAPLAKRLRDRGWLDDRAAKGGRTAWQLELVLPSFEQALVGFSHPDNRAAEPSGIVRLKMPAGAPSRSTLKLEEAWKVLLPGDNPWEYLGGGRTAVDLGAAPGGWTWQLVEVGMKVWAVDNGPMNEELMASGQVVHVREDGYFWHPRRPVDWMVCDIVDKPRRTVALVCEWFLDRHCRYSVFNLKLPMKKRFQEWEICRQILTETLEENEFRFRLTARHLYHDREEITCFLERLDH